MKRKKAFFIMMVFCTAIISVSLIGCGNELENFTDNLSKIQEAEELSATSKETVSKLRSLSYDTWQQQLDNLVNGRIELNYIREQGLRLINYKIIESENIDKNTPLTAKSLIAFYNDNSQINSFIIAPISDIELKHPTIKESINEFKKILLQNYSAPDLIAVQLTWSYEGYNFETVCWVTEKEIIYDDILSNIRIVTVEEKNIHLPQPRLKSGSESPTNISYSYSTATYAWSNIFGKTQAEASASVTVNGQKINDIKHMTTYSTSENYWANPGYSADAQMKVTQFSTGPNGSCQYVYGVMVGGGGGLNLTWNGSGFILPSGVSGTNGSGYINTSNLN